MTIFRFYLTILSYSNFDQFCAFFPTSSKPCKLYHHWLFTSPRLQQAPKDREYISLAFAFPALSYLLDTVQLKNDEYVGNLVMFPACSWVMACTDREITAQRLNLTPLIWAKRIPRHLTEGTHIMPVEKSLEVVENRQ